MTNAETADTLFKLAETYRAASTPLLAPNLGAYASSKDEVIALIKAVGGKFTKKLSYGEDYIYYNSHHIPGFSVTIPRDRVCRKIPARYECEPLLSPGDEQEIEEIS